MTNIENKAASVSCSNMDCSSDNNKNDCSTDGSESELEPSPKKSKLTALIARRCLTNSIMEDNLSPSKLKVAELRLSSKEQDAIKVHTGESSRSNNEIPCPPNVDKNVFEELPIEVQQELWDDFVAKKNLDQIIQNQKKKQRVNSILNYVVRNS